MSDFLSIGRHAVPPTAQRQLPAAAVPARDGAADAQAEKAGRRDDAAPLRRDELAHFERRGRSVRGAERAERRALESDIDRATRKIGKSLTKFLRRLDRLEAAAERIGTQLQRSLQRDIEAGRFEDRTPDQRIARIAHKFGHLEARLDRAGDRLYRDLGRVFERFGLSDAATGATDGPAIAVNLSQQVTLSVESLNVEIAGEGAEVSVSYSKIVFSVSSELSLTVAAPGTPVLDLAGQRFDIAEVAKGLYLDARNPDLRQLIAPVPDTPSAETQAPEAPAVSADEAAPAALPAETPPAEPADAAAAAAATTLLLIRAYSQTLTFGVTRILLDAATQYAPAQGDETPVLGDDAAADATAAGGDEDSPLDIAV